MLILGSITSFMKKILLLICLISFHVLPVSAEEGMLIPSLISAFESDMKARGMKLNATDIYNVNHSSLKDAVLHFGGGCTAELVSSKGLLLTNHHCGFSQIQSHSSLKNDYLKYGFWATDLKAELPNAGLTAARMVRIEDVTRSVLFGVNSSDDPLKQEQSMQKNISQLIKDAINGTHYEAEVKPFNYGNDFYLIVKEVFKDIRLVGAPPNSIGKFGGDTDNWVWPRHTGDFSVFRIYVGKDNKPATYSENNIPYSPIYFLPISLKDRKTGDFTMVYGFPGETEQHVVSGYLKFIIEKERPARIRMREKSLGAIDAAMGSSDDVRIKYAAKQASIANAYKKWIGQVDGLKRVDAIHIKMQREETYLQRAKSNEQWNAKYGEIIEQMNKHVEQGAKWEFEYAMGVEYFFVGPEYFKLGRALDDLSKNVQTLEKKGELNIAIDKLIKGAEGFFKNYNSGLDRRIFELLTEEYLLQINPDELKLINIGDLSKSVYSKSVLTDKERYLSFLSKFKASSVKTLQKDPGFKFFIEKFNRFRNEVGPNYSQFDEQMTALLKNYVAGKYEMFPDHKHWADANGTLRITYGQLEGSAPADGMTYLEHTSMDGIIAKYNSGHSDFELAPRMLEMYKSKDYGPYAQNGEFWVCFTGSNHTTGGNSGSPVIDAEGHLMGLNFDRTWESTMSDYMFDTNRCRNVVVDIRYVLWVIDKYSGAKHLVDEMELVTSTN